MPVPRAHQVQLSSQKLRPENYGPAFSKVASFADQIAGTAFADVVRLPTQKTLEQQGILLDFF